MEINRMPKDTGPRDQDTPVAVATRDGKLWVTLKDGRVIGTPLDWYITLSNATPEQLANYELMVDGIHWPDLDEDLSVDAMLRGRRPAWPGSIQEWQDRLEEVRREREEAADWMTPPQVAARYGLSRFTVNTAIRRKRIPAHKSSGTWLIRRQDAEAYWGKRR
jgi:excisionase family DNA binding protein